MTYRRTLSMTNGRNEVNQVAISPLRLRVTRDGVLFLAGLLGIGYETVIAQSDRPTLLLLFGAMIGLPAFLNKDEKDSDKKKKEDGDGS